MKKILILFLFLANALSSEDISRDKSEIDILLYQKIKMKDGVNLSAKIWKPAEMKEPLPAIFWFTPYIADEIHTDATYFAQNGYVFVSVDVRGRGDSEGEYLPLEKDGIDGAQVVEWIAQQSWCNGKVAMMGGSYRGMVQWQTLKELPPSLKTICPSASVGPGIDYPQPKNIFYSYAAQWLAYTSGQTRNEKLFGDPKFWPSKFYKLYSQYVPFSKLDEICGAPSKLFQKWISHPEYDDYWHSMVPQPADYSKFNIPILTITGYYDDDQPGAMNYYKMHNKYGNKNTVENHFLLIGPYDHSGTRKPKKELGGLTFPDNALLDMNKIQLEWFDWILKGKHKPEILKNRVNYYLMRENKWLHAPVLDSMHSGTLNYYLSSENGKAGDVFNSGTLSVDVHDDKSPDIFEYNPLNLINEKVFMNPNPSYLTSQEAAFEKDILIYHSPPLNKDIELAGYIKFIAFLSMNVPDADFIVSLYEIESDGTAVFIGNDFIRARYRKSLEKAELIKPGEINSYEFNDFYLTARKITKGSRLRLIFSCLNTPDREKNYCSGGDIRNETDKDARRAEIKLYHNKKYPSRLELPVK